MSMMISRISPLYLSCSFEALPLYPAVISPSTTYARPRARGTAYRPPPLPGVAFKRPTILSPTCCSGCSSPLCLLCYDEHDTAATIFPSHHNNSKDGPHSSTPTFTSLPYPPPAGLNHPTLPPALTSINSTTLKPAGTVYSDTDHERHPHQPSPTYD